MMTNWHRLFGLALIDFFTGSPYVVELEKDLSVKRQLLDVIIIEKGDGDPIDDLPDGLEHLSRHNLLTYKSHHEPLDSWTLDELLGHYVNYRKLISSTPDRLAPVEEFQLYGVCARYPQKLAAAVTLSSVQEGVYEVLWGTHRIRLIVLSQIPQTPNNALWQLFSAIPERVQYGTAQYRWHSPDHSTTVYQLYEFYKLEGLVMSYTYEDFYRDFTKDHLDKLTPEERLKGLSTDERLKGLSIDDLFQVFSVEEILKVLSMEELVQKLLEKVSPEELETYLKKHRHGQDN